jgi:hypothetical protein
LRLYRLDGLFESVLFCHLILCIFVDSAGETAPKIC